MSFLIALVVGFGVVAGITGLVWLRNGRDPRSPDDPSLLAAAPPPGMTAATATLVAGGSTHEAFIAALLDLATRDEIAFESEGVEAGVDRVGIAIRGAETGDPRVLLNRRLPIGEAEVWLLAQLKLAVTGRDEPADDGPAAAVELAAEPAAAVELAAEPAAAAELAAHHAAPRPPARADYISARRALTLTEPHFFGTQLGTDAKRHGWMAGVTGIRRAKWRIIALGEIVLGMVVSVVATNLFSEELIGLAMGIGLAGGVTYMSAGAMAARTREGARMKTQLAACARTLRATFARAASLDDAVSAGSLSWLASADQALVWGMALGLRPEVEALLGRSHPATGEDGARSVGYAPSWLTRPHGGRHAHDVPGGPASMLAGIERIGSEAPPMRIPGPPSLFPRPSGSR